MEYAIFIIFLTILKESCPLNPEILKYDQYMKDFEATGHQMKQETKDKKMDGSIIKRENRQNVEVFTKHPYPNGSQPSIPGDDSNTNMEAPFSLSEEEGKKQVDTFFNNLVKTLSDGERIKMTVLTTNHQWFKLDVWPCFEGVRQLLGDNCPHYRDSGTYAHKYGFVLMNFCNAAWLTEVRIHNVIRDLCKT